MAVTLNIGFDPESLARIQHLVAFQSVLDKNLLAATTETVDVFEKSAQAYMWSEFKNPTGPLEDDFHSFVYGWDNAELENWSDYAFRRNYGFSGMTDSLGRFFRYDWGIAFMEYALMDSLTEIQLIYELAILDTVIELGGR